MFNRMHLLQKLEELIESLRVEVRRIHSIEKKYSLKILNIDISEYPIEELQELQIKHGIKDQKNDFVSWNAEYKKEVLNDMYIQVLNNNILNIQLLIPELKQKFALKDKNDIHKILAKKIKKLKKCINSGEGYLYYDEEYRRLKNNLLNDRFDAIWQINEMYSVFPLMKRNESSFVIKNASYPFIAFDIQQWCDFELSFHLIPLFEEAILRNSEKAENSKNIQNLDERQDLIVPILNSPIFLDNMIWVFYEILIECNAIDGNYSPIRGKFRPICDAIFTKGRDLLFKYNLNKKDYINYLNNENGFNDNISKLSDGGIHEEKVKDLIKTKIDELNRIIKE